MAIFQEANFNRHTPNYIHFPGQGTQHAGMNDNLYEHFPHAKNRLDETEKILGYPLVKFTRDEGMLGRTRFAQPAIVSTSIITLEQMEELGILDPREIEMIAGHSVGLFAGLVRSGAVSYEEGIKLVEARAVGMQHASDLRPGKMESVLGLTVDEAYEVCDKVDDLYVSVVNDPKSTVMGGTYKALEDSHALYKKMKGVRPQEIPVDGPFHTPLMEPAQEIFARQLEQTTIKNPEILLMANTGAHLLATGREIKIEAMEQLTNPVKWVDVEEELHERGYTHAVEPSEKAILSKMKSRRRGGIVNGITVGVGAAGVAITLGTAWVLHELESHRHHDKDEK